MRVMILQHTHENADPIHNYSMKVSATRCRPCGSAWSAVLLPDKRL